MEQWSEPSSKANENFYELMLARVVCETKLSSYACCQKAFALYHFDQFPDEGLNLVQLCSSDLFISYFTSYAQHYPENS